jgi:hypothetical protein
MSLPCAVRHDEARYQKEWDEDDRRSDFKNGLHDIIEEMDQCVTDSPYSNLGISVLLNRVRVKCDELQERIVKEME